MEKQQNRCWAFKGVLGDASCEKLAKVVHCRNCENFSKVANEVMLSNQQKAAPSFSEIQQEPEADCALFVFKCADILFALNPEFVGEITRRAMIHRIPHRKNEIIAGISNINGELVLVVDIYRAMDLLLPENTGKRMILCNVAKGKFAFVIDDVFGIRRFYSEKISNAENEAKKFVSSVVDSEQGKIFVIDAELLASATTRRQI